MLPALQNVLPQWPGVHNLWNREGSSAPSETGAPSPDPAQPPSGQVPPGTPLQAQLAYQRWLEKMQGDPHLPSLQQLPPERLASYAEWVPVLVPQAVMAPPIITGGYAGFEIFRTARDTYRSSAELDKKERLRNTARKTGEVAVFHAVATFGIPGLLGHLTYKLTQKVLKHEKIPARLRNNPRWTAALATAAVAVATARIANNIGNAFLDWTYRPLVNHQQPRDWPILRDRVYRGEKKLHEAIQRWRQKLAPDPPPLPSEPLPPPRREHLSVYPPQTFRIMFG